MKYTILLKKRTLVCRNLFNLINQYFLVIKLTILKFYQRKSIFISIPKYAYWKINKNGKIHLYDNARIGRLPALVRINIFLRLRWQMISIFLYIFLTVNIRLFLLRIISRQKLTLLLSFLSHGHACIKNYKCMLLVGKI